MKIALAQINTTAGDISNNTNLILDSIDSAKKSGTDLIVFPKLVIVGNPAYDLLYREDIIKKYKEAISKIAKNCVNIAVLISIACSKDDCKNGATDNKSIRYLLLKNGRKNDITNIVEFKEPGAFLFTYLDASLIINTCVSPFSDDIYNQRFKHLNDLVRTINVFVFLMQFYFSLIVSFRL